MAVLKYNNAEFNAFPPIIREYATYQIAVKGNSEKTICEYMLDLRTFFRYYSCKKNGESIPDKDEFENISITHITLEDVASVTQTVIHEFLAYMTTAWKSSPTTRMRKLSSLRSFYKYLYSRKHYIDANPADDIDSPKKAKTLPKYMTYEESLKLLETIRNDIESPTNVRDYAIVVLFLNTGMRLSELVGLDLKSFSSDLSKVVVLGKGNKQRQIYLNEFSKKAVAEYLKIRLDPKYIATSDKAFFLSSREKRISGKTVQWMVNKYFDMSGFGFKGLSVHKLRHTAATLMYQSGKVDIRILKDVLGHEQLNTTQIYTHVVDRNLKDAIDSNPLANVNLKRPKN